MSFPLKGSSVIHEEWDGEPVNLMTRDDLIAFLMQGMNYIAVQGKDSKTSAAWLSEVALDILNTASNAGWEYEESEDDEEEPSLWKRKKH